MSVRVKVRVRDRVRVRVRFGDGISRNGFSFWLRKL